MEHQVPVSTTQQRTALFVDGDNISSNFADTLVQIARRFGRLDIARVYTDDSHFATWAKATGFKHVLSGTGKNATDILLCVEAVEIAMDQNLYSVLIAASDGDYTHLALKLKERGLYVVGIGEAKAPERFRKACHQFESLQTPCIGSAAAHDQCLTVLNPLERNVCSVIAKNAPCPNGLPIARLNPIMRHEFNTRISDQPYKTWRTYLSRQSALFALDKKGPNAKVRLTKKGREVAHPDK